MAKVSLIQTNFTAGELSPRLMGRVDVARYQNGAKRLENALVAVQGGIMRTWGTEFVQPTKFSDKKVRLIPYVFNRDQSYMVEFGDKYIRVFKNTKQVAELESPYSESMLPFINYVQGADTMFLAHQALPIHRLRRLSDESWLLAEAPFIVKPFDEVGNYPDIALTLEKNTANEDVANLAADFFLAADVGRNIICGAGLAEITAFVSRRSVKVKIKSAFSSNVIKGKSWQLESSPQTKCTCNLKEPIGQEVTLTLDAEGWRVEDVGKYVRLNKGLCLITRFTNARSVVAEIKTVLSATAKVPANAWSLESVVWSGDYGYPSSVTLHNQRLFCGGNVEKPQTIWMSKTAEYLNFELSTDDDDAASFTISSDQINPIAHLTQLDNPVVLTYGGEFSMSGSASKSAITPTNIQIKNHSAYGCNHVKPIRVGNELFFMQRSGRKLRSMVYDASSDSMVATDASILSEHITEGGIVDMAYQQEPESVLWMVRADGQLATLTVNAAQEVLAWARQYTDGEYESVATIPNGVADEVWVVVKREVNGESVRYLERFNRDVYSHSTKIFEGEQAKRVFRGLDHLEGKTVDVLADGSVMQKRQVVGGSVTIERDAKNVVIGLPYKTTVETLDVELQGATGTIQGSNKRVGEVVLRFMTTTGCSVNGDLLPFRQLGERVLDQPAPSFSGDYKIEALGWNNTITIEQDQPLPFYLLAVIKKVSVND
ncbi:hypothetical protein [Entomomonas moraniae]|uniref:hypothetical protein n=1 Tax=Entomomonas moraniae TaxID=2213226 RepID=UPI0013DF0125|nr:hypothetical protein [Entomomonas moraniae]